MKPFATYQHVEGEPMTERDKKEVNSKFWNEGKFDNFVKPFINYDCSGMTFIDMGCNAGIFLKKAKDIGFSTVIGIDGDSGAIERAFKYRERNRGEYELWRRKMERCIDELPMADVTVLANSHYYFLIGDWLEYLDKLQSKSRFVIIVTADKRAQVSMAASDVEGIKTYFEKNWRQFNGVITPSLEEDPYPRKLWGLCFESLHLERVPMDILDNGNHVQDGFYAELDAGKTYEETRYYRIIRKYRIDDQKRWSEAQLANFFEGRIALYESVKEHGILRPLIVNSRNRVIDGNHLYQIMKHLGHESIIIRRVV